ncbi:unnamed protein product [Leptosia nina]|uniref:Uncharacterized protein n=1 Tax=Leptosia nina TaxID=320188 RepID=A0AAV1JJL0_9NEOP
MKILISNCCLIIFVAVTSIQEEISCQAFYPGYGGLPSGNDDDDDLGLILTVLLLARQRHMGRRHNGYMGYNTPNYCSCCNGGATKRTIPIPYPIPFPTNCPVILRQPNMPSSNAANSTSNAGSNNTNTPTTPNNTTDGSYESYVSEEDNYDIKYTPLVICYGQQTTFLNHQNFKKQHGISDIPSRQNKPLCFSNNLTQDENGKTAKSQLINAQQILNSQNMRIPPEPQGSQQPGQQPMALPQISNQPQFMFSPQMHQQPILQSSVPHIITQTPTCNGQVSSSHSFDSPPQVQQTYTIPSPMITNLPSQLPCQQTEPPSLPMQYALTTPQPTFSSSLGSVAPNFVTPNIVTQSSPPRNIPFNVQGTPQNIYNVIPNGVTSNPVNAFSYPGYISNYGQNYESVLQQGPYRLISNYNPMSSFITPAYNEPSQSSSLKTLLPIILNLLKEKSSHCNCPCRSCNCECKKKRTSSPQITSGYSKQKKYPLSEDGPEIDVFSNEEETVRNVREPKRTGKLKNVIPDVSDESHNESLEYNDGTVKEEEE